jgi:hypothetical protein
MSSKVSLAGDYKSLNAFIAVAEKKYPGVDVKKAIIESTAPGWNMVKQNFINGGFDRPLIGNFAEKLDTALQTIAQTARPAPEAQAQAPKIKHEDLPAATPQQTAPTKFDQIRLQQEKRREEQRAQIKQMQVVEEPAPTTRPVEQSKARQQLDAKSVVPPAPSARGPIVQPAQQRRFVQSEPAPRPVAHTEPTPRPVVHQEPVFNRAEPPEKVDYCYYITMTALATAAVAVSVLMATRDSE